MSKTKSITREDKAIQLIDVGSVTLNLDGTATVRGSAGATYLVTKQGCTCSDYENRGADCKHVIACRTLCEMLRRCRREARETG